MNLAVNIYHILRYLRKIKAVIATVVIFMLLSAVGCTSGEAGGTSGKGDASGTDTSVNISGKGSTTGQSGTTNNGQDEITVKVVIPTGVPALSIIRMAYEKPGIHPGITVEYEITESTDVLSSRLVSGEADIAVIPTNLAAQLYNKGVKYYIAAPSVWGIFYMVATDQLAGWEALKGREIHTIGLGLTSDILTRYILSIHGVDPDKDVTMTYLTGAAELAPNFISGKSTLSIMPEPMLSTVMAKKPETVIVLDFQKEWAEATGLSGGYPQAALVIKKDTADKYPEFTDKFIAEYKESIEWLYTEPQKAGVYAAELKTGIAAEIVPVALPRMNIVFKTAAEAKGAVNEYLGVIFESSPEMIGGKLPGDDIYYTGSRNK